MIDIHKQGLVTQDDAFWMVRCVDEIIDAFKTATLTGTIWSQNIEAYFGLIRRADPKVADELRVLLLKLALATLK